MPARPNSLKELERQPVPPRRVSGTRLPPRKQRGHRAVLFLVLFSASGLFLAAVMLWDTTPRTPPLTENRLPSGDPDLERARTLYLRAMDLMSRRRFDEAYDVVSEARAAHLRLMDRFPEERYPGVVRIQDREWHLYQYERMLEERKTTSDLRRLALKSQADTRKALLEQALSEAAELAAEGKSLEAASRLKRFASEHPSTPEAQQALSEAARLAPLRPSPHPHLPSPARSGPSHKSMNECDNATAPEKTPLPRKPPFTDK